MSQSTPTIVLVAALLLSALSSCCANNVYCVTPTLPANTSCTSCPHNFTHCATLSEYAEEAESYFTSNTTMVLLPGDHTLGMNITAANILYKFLNLHSLIARLFHIMLKILPITLFSNAPKGCLLCY